MNTHPERPGAGDPGQGRRIGIDVGSVRIGVAVSDPDGILATPVETVVRVAGMSESDVLSRIVRIVAEYEAMEVIVGLPQTLRGEHGRAARAAVEFAERLRVSGVAVPIRLYDERLTTVAATRALHESGIRAKQMRPIIDRAAAVAILQGWLDERRAGRNRHTE